MSASEINAVLARIVQTAQSPEGLALMKARLNAVAQAVIDVTPSEMQTAATIAATCEAYFSLGKSADAFEVGLRENTRRATQARREKAKIDPDVLADFHDAITKGNVDPIATAIEYAVQNARPVPSIRSLTAEQRKFRPKPRGRPRSS